MGEKYAARGFGTKSAIAKHKAKVALALCFLLVLFVCNFPTLASLEDASSGPVHDGLADKHEAVWSERSTVQYEGLNKYAGGSKNDFLTNSHDKIISAQYDNLMNQIPTQKTHEETLIADITEEETEPELTEAKEEDIAIAEINVLSDVGEKIVDQSPAQFDLPESPPQTEEAPAILDVSVALIREEEVPRRFSSSNNTFVETKTEGASQSSSNRTAAAGTKAQDAPESRKSNSSVPAVDFSVITGNRSDIVNAFVWRKWEQVRALQLPYYTRKENFNNGDGDACEGRQIYVYDLPSEFNADLVAGCDTLLPWFSMCNFFVESGRGVPVDAADNGTQIFVPGDKWFNTHQYSLELVSHARILKYKCRTDDPNKASLFYIPYYAGLDVIRWHFHPNVTNDKRDELALRLSRWLEQQASWQKNGGRDHVLVLGKISWDFRRPANGQWGSRLLEFPFMQHTTRVMIERDPWALNDIGVPHPTYFHPQSASDIDSWLRHVHSQSRSSLVTFVGKERKNDPTNVRTALVQQCRNSTDCRFVDCDRNKCLHPAYVTKAFMATHFCMQPVGDSPTRRSVFDSLIAGCIPVLFHPCTAYVQYPWHLPANESSWSVYISEDEIRAGTGNVVEVLSKISPEQRDAMRENIIYNVIPGLLYSAPGSDVSPYRDALDITIDQLLYRAKHRSSAVISPIAPARN